MSIEAMKQALEALEWNLPVVEDWGGKDNLNLQHKAITALRQAIEQAEKQEPVQIAGFDVVIDESMPPNKFKFEQAEKQHPVEYTGNGTAGREADVRPTGFFFQADKKQDVELCSTESKVSFDQPVRVMGFNCVCGRRMEVSAEQGVVPAPHRQPLTDEEIEDLYFDKFSMGELKAFARAIEAKLKEKNT